jgi:hypothetical protein
MSTDYRLSKKVRLSDLLDGRLERFGVSEDVREGTFGPSPKPLIQRFFRSTSPSIGVSRRKKSGMRRGRRRQKSTEMSSTPTF